MPPNFHTYLQRATRLPGVAGVVGKAADFGLKVGDRLLGRSATLWRGRAQMATRTAEGPPGKYPALQGVNRYVNKIKGIADIEAKKSRNTRLAVGGAVLGGLALKKHLSPEPTSYYDNPQDYSV